MTTKEVLEGEEDMGEEENEEEEEKETEKEDGGEGGEGGRKVERRGGEGEE